jgi:hypothetical protein
MKLFKLILFLWLVFGLLFSSCKKEHISFYSFSERLTRNVWVSESFINQESNFEITAPPFTYEFKENGEFTIYSPNTNLSKNNTWELFGQNKYLRIGNDVYGVDFLSNKLLCLNYGNIRISLVPVE